MTRIFFLLILFMKSFQVLAITNGFPSIEKPWLIKVGLCGGALISKLHILTAAHCIYNQPPNLITLRRYVLNKDQVELLEYLPKAKEVLIHPNYKTWDSNGIKVNDLAIITLSIPIEANSNLLLPKKNEPVEELNVSGYGRLTSGKYPFFPYTINKLIPYPDKNDVTFWSTNLFLLESDDLNQDFLGSFFTGQYGAVQVNDGKSACRGDSGSPVFNNTIPPTLIGIVSHGQNDCVNQKVFFYTQILPYLNWIKVNTYD